MREAAGRHQTQETGYITQWKLRSMFALLGGTGSGYLRQGGGEQSVGVSGCFFESGSLFAGYTGVQTARHATRSSMSQEIEYSEKYADDEFEYRCSARLSAPRPRSGA